MRLLSFAVTVSQVITRADLVPLSPQEYHFPSALWGLWRLWRSALVITFSPPIPLHYELGLSFDLFIYLFIFFKVLPQGQECFPNKQTR